MAKVGSRFKKFLKRRSNTQPIGWRI